MRNRKPGSILRCTGLALLVLGVFVLLPAAAQAGVPVCTPGFHGASIFKTCVSPKNRCATDADCSDANICNGIEQCATAHPDGAPSGPGSNKIECTITLANPDIHCDNITIEDACDTILGSPQGSPVNSCALQITGTSTGVVGGTCTAGTDLVPNTTTCTIAPGGAVNFLANYYTISPLDASSLDDQAKITVKDECNNSPTGCSTTFSDVQFTASSTTVSGCSGGTPLVCNDNSACTTDTCDPGTGCVFTPIVCNDNSACTTDTCDPATGCVFTPIVCNDNNACTTDTCDPAIGCVFTPNPPCNDNSACTTDTCDPATGCVFTPIVCNDNNPCTDDTCDPATGCVFTDNGSCNVSEICRTPGFWGTHGGIEKSSSVNITQAVLDAFNGTLEVCGTTIDNTDVGNTHSALEAICVSPKGDSRLQLARQLTAAALNCGITNAGGTPGPPPECTVEGGADPCAGVSIHDVWAACNAACPTGTTATVDGHTVSCIGAIDCFNNGGIFDVATGDCGAAEGTSCHDRELVNGCFAFSPPGAAGSPRACNDARKNLVTVVPPLP